MDLALLGPPIRSGVISDSESLPSSSRSIDSKSHRPSPTPALHPNHFAPHTTRATIPPFVRTTPIPSVLDVDLLATRQRAARRRTQVGRSVQFIWNGDQMSSKLKPENMSIYSSTSMDSAQVSSVISTANICAPSAVTRDTAHATANRSAVDLLHTFLTLCPRRLVLRSQ